MIALLKKDWRINRGPMVGMLLVCAALCLFEGFALSVNTPSIALCVWLLQDGQTATWSLPALIAAFGGMAFARERRDKSADFLAMLPVSRTRIIVSKLIASLTYSLLMAGLISIPMNVGYSIFSRENSLEYSWSFIDSIGITMAAVSLMMFGIAWLLSTFLTAPAVCACVAIGAGIMLAFSIFDITNDGDLAYRWITGSSTAIGVTTVLSGAVYYFKRFEP